MRRLLLVFSIFSLVGMTASAQYVADWNPDADGDNTIGVNDLLALLSVFEETDSDNDGVYNSQSSEYAADWNPDADGDNSITVTDLLGLLSVFEETDSDNDGIFDSQDDCVGTFDVCGACNGPGPTVLIEGSLVCPVYGCTDNTASNFSATANTDDGTCTYGPAQCGGQSTVTFDGYTYNLVGIGTQCWFKENLRNDNYRNGDEIPSSPIGGDWTTTSFGVQTVFNTDPSTLDKYGRLYNGLAVLDQRGLCPSGFHVPTDLDWNILVHALGGHHTAGIGLKSSQADNESWDGTNASGFTALPGGSLMMNGLYGYYAGLNALFWTSSEIGMNIWNRFLYAAKDGVGRTFSDSHNCYSVRCLKDPEGVCSDEDLDGVCSQDEIHGCLDPTAQNFDPVATEEDGSCITMGVSQCDHSSSVIYDGKLYRLVGIGDQCWFKDNLSTSHYSNGDAIPGNLNDAEWGQTTTGAMAVFGEGESIVVQGSKDETVNIEVFGKLYNWYATVDPRGLCPSGFHVPTDEEWMTLEIHLGMSVDDAQNTAWRGTNQGEHMKSSWAYLFDGSDTSGFSALPGGQRFASGAYGNLGSYAHLWTSSIQHGLSAWSRSLLVITGKVYRDYAPGAEFRNKGFSVRCIRNEGLACYDPDNDGVCAENEVSGCTDSDASNFNPSATEDDGSCIFPGPAQCGGASTVTFDGYTYNLVGIGSQCWFKENLRSDNYRNGDAIPGDLDNDQWASTTSGAQAVYGNDPANLVTYGRLYNWFAVNDVRGLCPNEFHVPSDEELSSLMIYTGGHEIAGAMLKSSSTDIPPWDGTNSSGFSSLPGGLRFDLGNYSYGGSHGFLWSSSIDESDRAWIRILYSGTSYVNRYFQNLSGGVSVRCIRDTVALSVPIHGCTIIGACNYSPLADFNDGSCLIPDYCDFCEGDGIVYGDPDDDGVCAEDEFSGCTDNNATNFNPAATEEDGTCAYGPTQCGGTSTVTLDGYTYNLVAIGNQCWFKENLRSDHYRNGDEIPGNLSNSQWTSTTSGAQAVYHNNDVNLATYGRLYNWYAVNDARGLCPTDYHVPTDGEWTDLENFLGDASVAGSKMKSSPSDTPAWDGTNYSGFSALPGGEVAGNNGNFGGGGLDGYWWSSSASGTYNAWPRALYSNSDSVDRYSGHYVFSGWSVRCIRD